MQQTSRSKPVAEALDAIVAGAPRLSVKQFSAIGHIVRHHAGVDLHAGKEELVRSRVSRRLRILGLAGFDDYLRVLERDDGSELVELLDVITTNKTQFFRELPHFDFLTPVLPTWCGAAGPIRIWSAGCSSGEEPYSLGMLLHEELPPGDVRNARILATDISRPVLARAQQAVYRHSEVEGIDASRMRRHMLRHDDDAFAVRPEVRGMVTFARLNLMHDWPMRGPFHAIFCRNVMIYFDRETRERLIARFFALLRPGGFLFVGHSESLSGLRHEYRYVAPAVYVK
jgi:chemotaxis protein methyltransferase CheR